MSLVLQMQQPSLIKCYKGKEKEEERSGEMGNLSFKDNLSLKLIARDGQIK